MAPLFQPLALFSVLGCLKLTLGAPAHHPNRASALGSDLDRRLAVTFNVIQPTSPPPPRDGEGPWVDCDIVDDDCSCTSVNGSLRYYCGWVDPTWSSNPLKGHFGRVLQETDTSDNVTLDLDPDTADPNSAAEHSLDIGDFPDSDFNSSSPPDVDPPIGQWLPDDASNTDLSDLGDTNAATAGDEPYRRRDLGREIQLRRRHPLLFVLKVLNFSYRKILPDQLKTIITRMPAAEEGQFVQGIKGVFAQAVSISDGAGFHQKFKKGAKFEIRWDVTGTDPTGIANGNDFQGMHVNFLVDDGLVRQKWGIYQLGTSTFPKIFDFVPQYERIRTYLTNIAGYFPAPNPLNDHWSKSETLGAQAIAKVWHNQQNPHDEL